MTPESLKMVVGDIGRSTAAYVREALAATTEPLSQRIRALEQREEQLEAATYAGVWKSDVQYRLVASVTHRNGLWYARADSRGSRPGTSQDWQLASRAHEDRGST
jgi:hypothetical protein